MKSLKTILTLCALAAIPAFGDVEALYWQVTSGSGGNNPENISFSYATLVGVKDGAADSPYYYADAAGGTFQQSAADGKSTEVIASVIDADHATGWSFYIELWNYDNGDWTMVGRAGDPSSAASSYASLKDAGVIRSSMSMSNALFTPTAAIPEPTSGLLLLVGGALLALRRRRNAAMA